MHTTALRMNIDAFTWELDRLFGVLSSPCNRYMSGSTQLGTNGSTMVLNKIYVAFFISEIFGKLTSKVNEHLLAQFTLALEMSLREHYNFMMKVMKVVMTATYQNCSSDQPHIYVVSSAAQTSFNPTDCQESTTPTSLSTPKKNSDDKLLVKHPYLQLIPIVKQKRKTSLQQL